MWGDHAHPRRPHRIPIRPVLNAVGLLLGYIVYFAFAAVCLVMWVTVGPTCWAIAWVAGRVRSWRGRPADGLRGGLGARP